MKQECEEKTKKKSIGGGVWLLKVIKDGIKLVKYPHPKSKNKSL